MDRLCVSKGYCLLAVVLTQVLCDFNADSILDNILVSHNMEWLKSRKIGMQLSQQVIS